VYPARHHLPRLPAGRRENLQEMNGRPGQGRRHAPVMHEIRTRPPALRAACAAVTCRNIVKPNCNLLVVVSVIICRIYWTRDECRRDAAMFGGGMADGRLAQDGCPAVGRSAVGGSAVGHAAV